jgi:hypothetical protein
VVLGDLFGSQRWTLSWAVRSAGLPPSEGELVSPFVGDDQFEGCAGLDEQAVLREQARIGVVLIRRRRLQRDTSWERDPSEYDRVARTWVVVRRDHVPAPEADYRVGGVRRRWGYCGLRSQPENDREDECGSRGAPKTKARTHSVQYHQIAPPPRRDEPVSSGEAGDRSIRRLAGPS